MIRSMLQKAFQLNYDLEYVTKSISLKGGHWCKTLISAFNSETLGGPSRQHSTGSPLQALLY